MWSFKFKTFNKIILHFSLLLRVKYFEVCYNFYWLKFSLKIPNTKKNSTHKISLIKLENEWFPTIKPPLKKNGYMQSVWILLSFDLQSSLEHCSDHCLESNSITNLHNKKIKWNKL